MDSWHDSRVILPLSQIAIMFFDSYRKRQFTVVGFSCRMMFVTDMSLAAGHALPDCASLLH
jgi:hypothetical protein